MSIASCSASCFWFFWLAAPDSQGLLDLDALRCDSAQDSDVDGPGSSCTDVVDDAMLAFAQGAHQRFQRWVCGKYLRVKSRGGILVDVNTSPAAFRAIGSSLESGQRVKVRVHYRDSVLENGEEAVVLGVYNRHVV